MKAKSVMSIYSYIMNKYDKMSTKKIPISNIAHESKFFIVKPIGDNEDFRIEKADGDNKIILSIESFDHSKTFDTRPDTYHNYAYLYNSDKLIDKISYVYED